MIPVVIDTNVFVSGLRSDSGASTIITHNVRDIKHGELLLEKLLVLTPAEYLEKTR